MAEVLCVYREVQVLKRAAAKSRKAIERVAIVSYDEKPGIQAIATTAPDLPPKPGVHATFARDYEYKRLSRTRLQVNSCRRITFQSPFDSRHFIGIVRSSHSRSFHPIAAIWTPVGPGVNFLPIVNLTDAMLRGLKPGADELTDAKTGLMARVDSAGKIAFSFRYRFQGVRRRFTIGSHPTTTLHEARKLAGRVREQVRNGDDPQAERRSQRSAPAGMSFNELVDTYLEKYAKRSKSSWKNDAGLLRKAREAWGKLPATSITRQDAARLLLDVADQAPVSANRLRSTLVQMFNWGVAHALLDSSPMLGTKKPTKEGRGKTRTLSDAEIKLLWPAFDRARASSGTAAAFRVLLLLGQRPGEVAGMAVDELHDLDDPRRAVWSIPASRMKGRKPHLVPLLGLFDHSGRASRA